MGSRETCLARGKIKLGTLLLFRASLAKTYLSMRSVTQEYPFSAKNFIECSSKKFLRSGFMV